MTEPWRAYTPGQVCETMLGKDCVSGAVRITGRVPDVTTALVKTFAATSLPFTAADASSCEGAGELSGLTILTAHLHAVAYGTRDVVITYEAKMKLSPAARLLPILNFK